MERALEIGYLYGFYGGLLTERQRQLMELYYNEDFSLAEIASGQGISRQGVRDALERGAKQLQAYERQLELGRKYRAVLGCIATARAGLDRGDAKDVFAQLDAIAELWEE